MNRVPAMIYRRFTQNKAIFGILPSKNLPKIYWRFTLNLPKIYSLYQTLTQSLPKFYQRFGVYLLNFIQDLPYILAGTLKFSLYNALHCNGGYNGCCLAYMGKISNQDSNHYGCHWITLNKKSEVIISQ